MPTFTDQLRDAVGDVTVPASFDELTQRARARRASRRRRRAAIVVVTCLVVVIAGIGLRTRTSTHQRVAVAPSTSTGAPTPTSGPPSSPLFSTPSGDVLIFENGYDGITSVDLDHRVAIRRNSVGQRAGDQPFRVERAGTDVLVGWGEIFAAPIAGGPSRSLGVATVYIPAVEPDRVWLVDYPNEAGTPPRAKFVVESTGAVVADVDSPFVGDASIGTGIPGGFALVKGSGIDLWQLSTQRVVGHLGSSAGGQGQTLDAVGSMFAWCQDDPVTFACDTLHVTDLGARGGPHDVFTSTYPGRQIISVRISPDGTRAAVATAAPTSGHPGNADRSTTEVTVEGADSHRPLGAAPEFSSLGWSSDGARLYVVSNSFQPSVTSIERWSAATDTVENAVLSTGDLFQFVSATEAELGPLPDPVTTAADCPKPDPNGDGTPSDCAFGL